MCYEVYYLYFAFLIVDVHVIFKLLFPMILTIDRL